jgi:hypothetical protein
MSVTFIHSAGCAAIGRLGVPVFLIPGNHDHGGQLGLREQPFFEPEREQLAPNLRVLLKAGPSLPPTSHVHGE